MSHSDGAGRDGRRWLGDGGTSAVGMYMGGGVNEALCGKCLRRKRYVPPAGALERRERQRQRRRADTY